MFGRRLTSTNPALKAMVLYGLGLGIMKGVSLLMLPWLTKVLPQADFGRLELIMSIAMFSSIVAGMGLQEAMCRFIGDATDAAHKRTIAAEFYGLALLIALLSLPLLLGLAWFISQQFPALFSLYQLGLVLSLLAFESCISLPLTWMRMADKPWLFFLATTSRALLNVVLILAFTEAGRGLDGIVEAGSVAALCQLIILTGYQCQATGVRLSRRFLRPLAVYGLPIIATGLMAFTLNGLDRWILQAFTSAESVAIFAVAAKFAIGLVLLQQPFTFWWFPRRFDVLFNQGQQAAVKMTSLGVGILCVLAITLGTLTPALIVSVMPSAYAPAINIAMILIMAALFKESAELMNLASLSQGSSEKQLYINILASMIGVALMLLLTQNHGVLGLSMSLVFAQGLRLVLLTWLGHKMLPLPYPALTLISMILLTFGLLLLGMLDLALWQRLCLGVIGVTTLGFLLVSSGLVFNQRGRWKLASRSV
ncbi:lipopolysaccharide biosynthesis protein [Shewanella sp. SNU WT4]|uniref:lipopolysaccharide biosynthesis protein n=1 Tax=Shewanella sp. SNU WT4 TaxID=2590015 RepID=UPI0011290201|nr:oligosaccharide flippase family protein [Shewanella sp. SNU WT4]QDF68139.1 lipopolysaccharide biosynthesis protein [Shewanella sp. SNU WT4]